MDDAVALARMTVQEAQEAHDLYRSWLGRLPALMVDLGVPEHALAESSLATAQVAEGLEVGWNRYVELIELFAQRAEDAPVARGLLEDARSSWLAAHDPATDRLAGLLALAADTIGEAVVGRLWDALLVDYYDAVSEKYDPATVPWSRSVERLGLDIFEAVRGHLTGPLRDGSFAVREEPDRWVLEFAPCGSGGRTYPGSTAGERDPREFTQGKHDWAWRTEGVCLYCAHCCQLQQRAPIQALGFPLRVIEPPVRATGRAPGRATCTWSIYKDPAATPAHAWTDVGADAPAGAPVTRR
ncbi:hypothetical protein [Nocardioides sp. Root190]|uniref:hypothetical protein n=1 Tax=Nocardioides sp. Root190 TaxID=1736488 RepID=UPI0012FA46B1|nr:hypothetical protein [Nocardioides sp. Root190]